jgi:ketosteroid isomerase-like protein
MLADDLSMVALNGSVLDRSSLIGAIGAGHLRFHEITLIESAVRFYPPLAAVVGRTEMKGSAGGTPFTASSRYTHIYARQKNSYRLVAAQGTPILAQ